MRDAVIAVIDDDELVRASTSSLLRSFGYTTAVYSSGSDFLQSGERPVDCILTDLQMPDLSGLKLGAALKEQGSSVPMILMTAFSSPSVQAEANALNMACLLDKPLCPEQLLGALRQALAA